MKTTEGKIPNEALVFEIMERSIYEKWFTHKGNKTTTDCSKIANYVSKKIASQRKEFEEELVRLQTYWIKRVETKEKEAKAEGIREGIQRFYEAIDKEYESFNVTVDIAKIMTKLKDDLGDKA